MLMHVALGLISGEMRNRLQKQKEVALNLATELYKARQAHARQLSLMPRRPIINLNQDHAVRPPHTN